MLIEDAVYRFLCDDPPLTALAPDQCILIDSLSKRIAPGLATGFICAPVGLRERLMTSVRSGGWGASGYNFEAGLRLMSDGTADKIAALETPGRGQCASRSPQNVSPVSRWRPTAAPFTCG